MEKLFKKSVVALLSMFLFIVVMAVGVINVNAKEINPSPKATVFDAWLIFDVWTGSGLSSVSIDNDIFSGSMNGLVGIDEFEKLQYNGVEFDQSNYMVTEVNGKTVIRLTEEYLKTLADGTYQFNAEFSKATIPLKLYIITHKVLLKDAYFNFDTWAGSGSAHVHLDPNMYSFTFEPVLFEKLLYKGKEVDRSNYSISAFMNKMTITLTEEYLKTLSSGEHYFEANFLNVNVNLKLKVDINSNSGEVVLKKGKKFKLGNLWYQVVTPATANTSGTVLVVAPIRKSIKKVSIPASVKYSNARFKVESIAKKAFSGCKKLTKVTIGKNIKKIESKAFYNAKKLKRITIKSKKLTAVGKSSFKNIHKSAKIKVPATKLKTYKGKVLKGKGQNKTVEITK